MKNKLLRHPLILAFLCGWLSVAALPPFYLFPFLFITFGIFLGLLNLFPGFKNGFKIGYAFGFGFFAFGFSWIGNALLIDIASFGWLYPLVLIACGAFFGLFAAFPAAISSYFTSFRARYLALAALWVIFEWLRSFILTGFPWNLLGTVLGFQNELLQTASQGGTYLLSLLVFLTVTAPALFFHYRTRISLFLSIFIPAVILGCLFLYGHNRLANQCFEESSTTIRLVQPAIPQAMKWNRSTLEDNFSKYIALSQSFGHDKVDFVIWGETAAPYPLDLDPDHLKLVTKAVPADGYLITGLVRYEFDADGKYYPYNSLFTIDRSGRILNHYDKFHLVPFGEYIPLKQYLPEWVRPLASIIGTFRAGSGPQRLEVAGQPSFGALICYEVIFPHQILNQQQRPDWIINLTNDGWYGNSAGPRQHLLSTRLRAIEEGITIARAANTGISALISPYGTILGQIDLNKKGILDIKLPRNSQFSTTYSRFGNIIILTVSALLILLAFALPKD